MMYMQLEIRENSIYCDLRESDSYVNIADLRAEKLEKLKNTWFVTSSTHADSEALNDFDAPDQWIAAPLLIGIARRLYRGILAGEEE